MVMVQLTFYKYKYRINRDTSALLKILTIIITRVYDIYTTNNSFMHIQF